ncbi:uncharacterized mitochondrial protein AtMg00860-like [Benincasa hispida]|uniref:uncharacterized mitochondrial protein AtMg00860-like n=1 Tax=Benincasa hispida TaxID=102211 RepID=UPI001902291A|nr:uncharacterized mitochondrial protein AtMg00860-like [Benincasa hispida]
MRHYEHHIELKPEEGPVNVRPYRYPQFQKDEIKKLVEEMLTVGIIQPSIIYSSSLYDHVHHLSMVLQALEDNQFMANLKKCTFGAKQIDYLGHIISEQGVAVDPSKVEAMLQWSPPTTVKQLRGFLGLMGYYRKFVPHYGSLAFPLTQQLKKDKL